MDDGLQRLLFDVWLFLVVFLLLRQVFLDLLRVGAYVAGQ
jgi:hypothetical protein